MTNQCEHGQLARQCEVCELVGFFETRERQQGKPRRAVVIPINERSA